MNCQQTKESIHLRLADDSLKITHLWENSIRTGAISKCSTRRARIAENHAMYHFSLKATGRFIAGNASQDSGTKTGRNSISRIVLHLLAI